MTWFMVDDSFHSHPKALATEPAALGLWVIAGSWCGDNLTDGLVPLHVLPRLLPGSATLAEALVAAGLWTRTKRGYQFHDWAHWNKTADVVRELRRKKAEAGRIGGLNSAKARSKPQARARAPAKQVLAPLANPEPLAPLTGGSVGVGAPLAAEGVTHVTAVTEPKPHRFVEGSNGFCRCGRARADKLHISKIAGRK